MLYDKRWDAATAPVDEIEQILLAAAAYIESHGWCQGMARDPYGRVCTVGAIAVSCTGQNTRMRVLQRVERLVGPVAGWNDAYGRTEEEVTAVLRSAASLTSTERKGEP